MRLGLIADIHGNLFALREVLRELDRLEVERVYSLGDLATPGPWPAEVMALLIGRGIHSVMGNTDQWLLASADDVVSDSPRMNEIAHWAAAMLGDAWLGEIAALPMYRTIELATGTVAALFHGSPASTEEVFSALTPSSEISGALARIGAAVGVGGHTHVPMVRDLGSAVMVNPGSVGLGGIGPGTPDLPPPRPVSTACYAVMTVSDGSIDTELRSIELDIPRMFAEAERTGMPHLDWWASLWDAGGNDG